MEEFLARVEEAKKRDHNKLGRELGIFMTEENIGQGLPLFMPKGAHILKTMQRWVEDEEEKRGYMITKTPFMAKAIYTKSAVIGITTATPCLYLEIPKRQTSTRRCWL